MWSIVTRMQTCASLNHRKKMKAESSRLISRKHTANRELLIVLFFGYILRRRNAENISGLEKFVVKIL